MGKKKGYKKLETLPYQETTERTYAADNNENNENDTNITIPPNNSLNDKESPSLSASTSASTTTSVASTPSNENGYNNNNNNNNDNDNEKVGGAFVRTESKTLLVTDESSPLMINKPSIGHGHGHFVSEGRQRNTSVTQTVVNLIKSYIASGILGLPYAFKQSGVIGSSIVMLILMSISVHSMLVLVDCKNKLASIGVVTFADIANYAFGKKMSYLVDFLLIFTQFGFATVYMVYVSTNLAQYWDVDYAQVYILLMLFPLFVGMSWIRTLRWIGPVSGFANFSLLAGILIVLIMGFTNMKEEYIPSGDIKLFDFSGLPITFGMSVYAIEGIGVIIPCETAMKEPQKFPRVLTLCLFFAGGCYIFFASSLYAAFGDSVSDQLLKDNIPAFTDAAPSAWLAFENIARIALVIAIFLSFPMQLFVVIDIVEEALFKPGRLNSNNRRLKENIVRTLLCVLGATIALTVPEFSLLISLIGAMGGASLQFVLPALFHLKLFPEASTPRKALSVLYIIFGLVGGGYGTYDTISQLIDKL